MTCDEGARGIIPGDICRCQHGDLGCVTGSVIQASADGRRTKWLGVRLRDGGQWSSLAPVLVCHGRDLLVPVPEAIHETAVEHPPGRIPLVLAAVRREWEESPDMRLGQLFHNVARNLHKDLYALEDEELRAALDLEHPPLSVSDAG